MMKVGKYYNVKYCGNPYTIKNQNPEGTIIKCIEGPNNYDSFKCELFYNYCGKELERNEWSICETYNTCIEITLKELRKEKLDKINGI